MAEIIIRFDGNDEKEHFFMLSHVRSICEEGDAARPWTVKFRDRGTTGLTNAQANALKQFISASPDYSIQDIG